LAGAYRPDEGKIFIRGREVSFSSPNDSQGYGVSIIYQEFNLIPELNVAENMFLGREPRNKFGFIDNALLYEKSSEMLALLGVQMDLKSPIKDLGIAKQQMVEIGKALSVNADIIVMDEPSAVVSGKELEALFRIIRSLKASNKTIIYISHRIDEIFQISDRTTVLKDGKVVGTVATASVDRPTIVRMMVGRSFAEVFPQKGTQISKDDLLVLNSVTRANILKNISFRVHRGEILGIAGLLGAGRTELARAIFGADPFDKGEISMRGIRIKQRRPRTSIAEGIGFVTENRAQDGLVNSLSVKENITLAILDKVKRWFVILDQKEKQIGSAAIKQFNIIVSSIQQEVKYLSGGNQQKVILARWINIAPDLLILDEPTRGIDVGAKAEIYLLMRRLSDRGVAIMMISSELPEIIGMSDRIIVMHDGAIMGELFSAEATEEKILMLATGQAGKTGQGGG